MAKKTIGIKNCYYAPVTIEGESVTFSTPVRIPDLESLTAENTYASGKNFADNLCNIDINVLTGATLTAEFSHVSRETEAILGGRKYSNGAMEVHSDDAQKSVAILYELVFNDGSTERIVYYNCTLVRNGNGGQTKTENINFTGVTLSGGAISLPDGRIMLAIASDEIAEDTTVKELFDNFFTEVAELKA